MKSYVKRNFFISELRNRSFFLSICKDFLQTEKMETQKWTTENSANAIT